jgi:hypothetical protein
VQLLNPTNPIWARLGQHHRRSSSRCTFDNWAFCSSAAAVLLAILLLELPTDRCFGSAPSVCGQQRRHVYEHCRCHFYMKILIYEIFKL